MMLESSRASTIRALKLFKVIQHVTSLDVHHRLSIKRSHFRSRSGLNIVISLLSTFATIHS
jgi:hypothetical protein